MDQIIDQSRASIEKEDLKVLLPLITKIEPEAILEIGMHQGYSMELWRRAFNPVILIGIEKDAPTPESYTAEAGMHWNTNSHTQNILSNISGYYDFLFIDGDHTYDGVRQDFEMYSPLVRKGGIIALHDACYLNMMNVVKPFWEEIRNKYPYVEIKVGERSTGIGVIWV